MNVAMVVYSHYSRDARVRRYAELLSRNKYKIDIICLWENYQPKESNIRLLMFPFSRKRLSRVWYFLEYGLFFLYSLLRLSSLHLAKRYKIIHVHNMPDFLVFTALLPKLIGAKIILDMHDPMPELYMSKYKTDREYFLVRLLILIEKFSFNFADLVITANYAFKKIFLSRHNIDPKKISVILNCPDSRVFKPKVKKDKKKTHFVLFYMGTVDERFGLDIAIEGLSKLISQIPKNRQACCG